MNGPGVQRHARWVWLTVTLLIGCGLSLAVAIGVRGCLPGGDGIIARAVSSDGTEMCVVQTYNGSFAEPYTVGFYYRRPGKPWGWFYYEHEDTRWGSGKIVFNEDSRKASILRGGRVVARFDIPTESFTIVRWNRTLSPAQEWMPPGWKPEDALTQDRNRPKSPTEAGAPTDLPPGQR